MHALCLNHFLIFDASTAHDSLELEFGQNYFNIHQVKIKMSSFAFMCHIHFPPRNGLESRIITQKPENMVALMSSPFYIHR